MPTLSSLARPTVLISFVMLVLAITLLYLSQGFGRSSGMFPRFIGWVFVVLTAADVIVQVVAWYQRKLPVPTATSITIKQLKAMGWLLGLVVALSIFGFLITIPAYIFTFPDLACRTGEAAICRHSNRRSGFCMGYFCLVTGLRTLCGSVAEQPWLSDWQAE